MCNFSAIKNALIFGLLCLGLLAISAPSWAQSTTDGAIGGTVTDPSGAVIPGASISVVNLGTNAKAGGTTDGGGRYVITHLVPGVYTVEINAAGFGTYRQENVTVEVGRTTTIEASLGVAKQTQTVVATAEAPV
ncbi:MAG: carboxypeptidase-like regulatory domain-containing protein, partial [Candidatus Acidiferrales bacterium]